VGKKNLIFPNALKEKKKLRLRITVWRYRAT